jgi:hypothetical protein
MKLASLSDKRVNRRSSWLSDTFNQFTALGLSNECMQYDELPTYRTIMSSPLVKCAVRHHSVLPLQQWKKGSLQTIHRVTKYDVKRS